MEQAGQRRAYKMEKDYRVIKRMLAVNMVCMRNRTIEYAVEDIIKSPDWVRRWVKRYNEGGIEALRNNS